MRPDISIVEGAYLHDILAQPQALKDTLRALSVPPELAALARHLGSGRFRRIVLTGMGSSFHALHPLNLELVSCGMTAIMTETSELVHYQGRFFDPTTLIVAVSQSGRSAETLRLLELNRGHASVIAVTNTADSPLARRSDVAILTRAGAEFSVSCKTYLSALMALDWLAAILCGRSSRACYRELEKAAPAVSAYLTAWKGHVRSLCRELKGIRHLFLVGRGSSLAAAGTGALIIKEASHFHAEAMSSAAFRHGPFEMLGWKIFVVIFSGNPETRGLNEGLLHDILKEHGRAGYVAERSSLEAFRMPAAPDRIRPILEMLPTQMVTLALAAQAGREPGRFELASKVTTTE